MAEPARRVPLATGDDDPFRYGYREQVVRRPDGGLDLIQVPLTLDDLLDPRIGDRVTQSGRHSRLAKNLFDLLERRYESRDDVVVCFDRKILWRTPGLPDPSPDIMVIQGIRDKPRAMDADSFDVVREGSRPCFIIEVVSTSDPDLWHMDHVRKKKVYEQAGVPEYLIIDPFSLAKQSPLELTGDRLGTDRRYRPLEPDSGGRLLFESVGLLFGAAPDRQTLELVDAETGERLLDSSEEKARADRAEAELARLREELESLKRG